MIKNRQPRRYSADPDLTAMANDVQHLSFELDDGDYDTFQSKWREGSLINVSMFPDGRTFRVRICVGGANQTIAITTRGPEAAAYADMAKLFFWPYRMRNKRPPGDADFNYSLEQARNALETNAIAVQLLERQKAHLIATGQLRVVSAASSAEEGELQAVKESRRTVAGVLREALVENTGAVQSLEKHVNAEYEEMRKAFRHILEELKSMNTAFRDTVVQLATVNKQLLEVRHDLNQLRFPPPASLPCPPAQPYKWDGVPDSVYSGVPIVTRKGAS